MKKLLFIKRVAAIFITLLVSHPSNAQKNKFGTGTITISIGAGMGRNPYGGSIIPI